MLEHLGSNSRSLYNTGIGSQVASEYSYTAVGHIGIVDGSDDVGILVYYTCDILSNCLACAGQAVCIYEILLCQLVKYCVYAACLVEIFHISVTGRSQMTDIGSLLGDLIYQFKIQLYAAFMCYSGQVQHRVCRAAQCHIGSDSVPESLLCHYVAGTDILFQQFHYLHTCLLSQLYPCGISCGDGAVSAKTHTQYFGQAVHGVCGVHTRT